MGRFRRGWNIVPIGALLAGTVVVAAPGTASAATTVTCGSVITTSVTLKSDVGPCPADGLHVAASGVTLNLDGHKVFQSLTGPVNDVGITLDGVSGVTVKDGTVTGFAAGVAVSGGSGNTIKGIYAHDNINRNLIGPGPNFDQTACDYGDGIITQGSSGNTIKDNKVVHNGPYDGITLTGSPGQTFTGNVVKDNTVLDNNVPNLVIGASLPPVYPTYDPAGAQLTPGNVGSCGSPFSRPVQDIGIRVEGPGALNNTVSGNYVSNSAIGGITIHGYVYHPPCLPNCPADIQNSGNVIRDNTVVDTGKDTVAYDSLADGIGILRQGPGSVVGVSQGNTIIDNTVLSSYRDGIFVGNPTQPGSLAGNTVRGNVVRGSKTDGIAVAGVTPGRSTNNKIIENAASGSGRFDGFDGNGYAPNTNTACDSNRWSGNHFATVNQSCVRGH